MCVIAAAAKKRYMKRAEVVQAMKANNAGFFGFTVHDGVRRTIRTLDDKEFLKFFDEVVEDDDMWVMHARIPSRGDRNVDNVHGWEQDGILFCHNMTLSQLDDMMKNAKWEGTDSEFFFRHVFIPFYRGCGPDAYKDGKFCGDLDNLVRHFCGHQNKFLFIMPDNTVVRYGDWVEEPGRKTEDGGPGFVASNRSYQVYEARWPACPVGFGAVGGYGGGYCRQFNDGDWGDFGDFDDEVPTAGPAGAGPAPAPDDLRRKGELVELVRRTCGDARLCMFALCDVVAHGTVSYRAVNGECSPADEDDDVETYLSELVPDCFDEDTYDAAIRGFEPLAAGQDADGAEFGPRQYAEMYADEFAERLLKLGAKSGAGVGIVPTFPRPAHVEAGLKALSRQWRVFARIANVAVDFAAKGAASFACVADNPERDGNRWKTNKVRADDVLVDETESPETTYAAIGKLLEYIRAEAAKEALS